MFVGHWSSYDFNQKLFVWECPCLYFFKTNQSTLRAYMRLLWDSQGQHWLLQTLDCTNKTVCFEESKFSTHWKITLLSTLEDPVQVVLPSCTGVGMKLGKSSKPVLGRNCGTSTTDFIWAGEVSNSWKRREDWSSFS